MAWGLKEAGRKRTRENIVKVEAGEEGRARAVPPNTAAPSHRGLFKFKL